MTLRQLLIVDDEENILFGLKKLFELKGYEVLAAPDAMTALGWLRAKKGQRIEPEAMLLDVQLPDALGLDVLREVRKLRPTMPVLMITGHGNVPEAVAALQLGASDYILKPFHVDEIHGRLQRALEAKRNAGSKGPRSQGAMEPDVWAMGPNPQMALLLDRLERTAASPATTVLIYGETGTGKELVARRLHSLGERAARPLIEINAAALTKELLESELFGHEAGAFTGASRQKRGLFEAAHGGTLFLDEVGDMELGIQAKLLRALQERRIRRVGGLEHIEVDVRFVAATNKDLAQEVKAGRFREDLFYRLNVVSLHVPALRDRLDDLEALVLHWLERLNRELNRSVKSVSPEALARLQQHPWPGNIRELRNCLERALLLECSGEELAAEHLQFLRPAD